MRLLLAAFGSAGDVQPMLSLAKGLKRAGYDVVVAAGTNFQETVAAHGLDFEPFNEDVQAAMNTQIGKEWLAGSSANPRRELENMRRMAEASAPKIAADIARMIDQADMFISGLMTLAPLAGAAQRRGKQVIAAWLAPMMPTDSGAAGMQAPFPRQKSRLNRWFGYMIEAMLWNIFTEPTNQTHRRLNLPPAKRGDFMRILNQTPALCGFSPLVVPRPDDWPDHHHITGYWHAPSPVSWTPPRELTDFLAAGEAPVYIGFGSMSSSDPAGTTRILVEALQKAGKRGIIYSGWAGFDAENLPESIFLLKGAPHDWLFPKMAAVVHHGGAGTTAAGLRAGVPSMVVAHMGDQPFWGRRIHELGVGAKPLRRHELTAERLAAGIVEMTGSAEIRRRAAEMGRALAQEDGVANAVEVISRQLDSAPILAK